VKVTAPKVTQPSYASEFLKGAFFIDEDTVRSLDRTFAGTCGEPTERKFRLTNKNGTQYEVSEIDEIPLLPLHDVKSREKFELIFQNGDVFNRHKLDITCHFGSPARIHVSGWSDVHAKFLCGQAVSLLEASRAWYGWIYSWHWFWVASVPFWLCGPLFASYKDLPQIIVTYALYFYGALFVTIIAAVATKRWLFDPLILAWGTEKTRQDGLARARRVVFGTCILGSAGILLAAMASSWFK
jgi:hypothetical protein